MPRAQANRTPTATSALETAAPYPSAKTKRKTANRTQSGTLNSSDVTEDPLIFLREVKLEGEDEGEVPIYDSCDEIRRKIRAFFRDPRYSKITQKRFLEEIGNVNSNTYRRFMKKKGEGCGAESGCFTGAYIFFEKKRIYENKPKGKKRLESEEDYPHGRPLEDDNRRRMWICSADMSPPTQKQARIAIARGLI